MMKRTRLRKIAPPFVPGSNNIGSLLPPAESEGSLSEDIYSGGAFLLHVAMFVFELKLTAFGAQRGATKASIETHDIIKTAAASKQKLLVGGPFMVSRLRFFL